MTPELTREIIVGVAAVALTALFTGVPAALLFWWTWQRDQERLVVTVTTKRWVADKLVPSRDEFGPACGILIRNRSLFPVHISSAGFKIDGQVIVLEDLLLPHKTKLISDSYGNSRAVADDSFDPTEIPVQKFVQIRPYGRRDRTKIVDALKAAAEKQGVPIETILASSRVVAIVELETGKEFTSETIPQRLLRRALQFTGQADE
jgi:hypothetical protein